MSPSWASRSPRRSGKRSSWASRTSFRCRRRRICASTGSTPTLLHWIRPKHASSSSTRGAWSSPRSSPAPTTSSIPSARDEVRLPWGSRRPGSSVAAQVLTRHHADGSVEVRSAGSEPGEGVNPVVAQVLAERGLPVTGHVPTKLDTELVQGADVVITMGCGETCPVFPGTRCEDWTVDDPAGQDLDTVQRIVDDIDSRVLDLLDRLRAATSAS